MNTLGNIFRITTYGESHGPAMGVVIDGCPAGLEIDIEFVQKEMARRRPGQSDISSPRNETDEIEILSGVYEGKSIGSPISIVIKNKDQQSKDYNTLEKTFRPSHADYTYYEKYGIRDHRGGGRSSARETANWVAAGAIAKLFLKTKGIYIHAFVKQIGNISLNKNYDSLDLNTTDNYITRCPDAELDKQMQAAILQVKEEGDTLGGIIQCVAQNVPVGLGEPVFGKLQAALAAAMMGINAAKGFEIGSGFFAASKKGSEHNDIFENIGGHITTKTNNSGGIQGGISNGMPIWFNVAFKPVSSIKIPQNTIDQVGNNKEIQISGRHDPCVVPRAVPIVEALTALVLADYYLLAKTQN